MKLCVLCLCSSSIFTVYYEEALLQVVVPHSEVAVKSVNDAILSHSLSQVPTSSTELSTMLLPRPSSTQGSERRGRALSAASYLTDAMEGEGIKTTSSDKW